jgi:hypothetical protein
MQRSGPVTSERVFELIYSEAVLIQGTGRKDDHQLPKAGDLRNEVVDR